MDSRGAAPRLIPSRAGAGGASDSLYGGLVVFKYILSDADVNRLVRVPELVEQVRSVLVDGVRAGDRVSVEYEGSWFASMIAAGHGYFTSKLVGVYPGNVERGLPLVRAVLVAFRASDGEPVVLMDATVATAWRTAAATAVALEALGAPRGGVYGIIGAGVQGTYHALVIQRMFSPSEVLVASRTRAKAEALAARLENARVVDLDTLLSSSEVVVAATNSTRPVVKGDLLRKDAIVASVGAPRPVRELDERVAERGRCVVVDTRSGALAETDDVAGFREIVELSELLRGRRCQWGDIRVYKSVGTSLLDHAMLLYILGRLGRQPRG